MSDTSGGERGTPDTALRLRMRRSRSRPEEAPTDEPLHPRPPTEGEREHWTLALASSGKMWEEGQIQGYGRPGMSSVKRLEKRIQHELDIYRRATRLTQIKVVKEGGSIESRFVIINIRAKNQRWPKVRNKVYRNVNKFYSTMMVHIP